MAAGRTYIQGRQDRWAAARVMSRFSAANCCAITQQVMSRDGMKSPVAIVYRPEWVQVMPEDVMAYHDATDDIFDYLHMEETQNESEH